LIGIELPEGDFEILKEEDKEPVCNRQVGKNQL
jgi:hypothetical protein